MKAPAICETCGSVFSSGLDVLAENVGLFNIAVGPCPKCHGDGRILDGVYSFVDNALLLLSDSDRTKAELVKLAAILKNATIVQTSASELSEQIQSEIPELSSLGDILPKTRTELYAFVAIIIALITTIISSWSGDQKPKIEINQVVNVHYDTNLGQQNNNVTKSMRTVRDSNKNIIGRNHLCPCGSGLKYKKCCMPK